MIPIAAAILNSPLVDFAAVTDAHQMRTTYPLGLWLVPIVFFVMTESATVMHPSLSHLAALTRWQVVVRAVQHRCLPGYLPGDRPQRGKGQFRSRPSISF